MTKKTFVLLSLDDAKSKDIAKVISNPTAKKILDYLGSKEEASATEISKELNLPLNTTEYNLNALIKSGLLESPEFKWSEKGKKVDIYKIAKKLIVIAPKGTESLANRLSGILPAILVTAIGSIALYLKFQPEEIIAKSMDAALESAPTLVMKASDVAMTEIAPAAISPLPYFLLGAFLAITSIILYSCYTYWRSRK